MRISRTSVVGVAALGLTLLGYSAAGAALAKAPPCHTPCAKANGNPYPPGQHCGTSTSSNSIPPGGTFHAQSQTFCPGEDVSWDAHSAGTHLATTVANAQGVASATLTLPSNFSTGGHTLTATGLSSGLVESAGFTVPAAATSGSGGLPFTGLEIGLSGAVVGLIAIAVGSAMVAATRRRRATTA
ncbi:MAG TPA: hypothetical protein VNG13_14880 [Mycobacteriales bacterium]|nr:hypothetical protein [Mycobacteriales bacterium]